MNFKLIYSILFFPMMLFAQDFSVADTLKIKIEPIISNRVVLYSAVGAQQKFINYSDSSIGEFQVSIPKASHKGVYRLVFDQETMNYIDFLYLGKGFSVQIDPTKLDKSPVFTNSGTNTRYFTVLNAIGKHQQILDSLQVRYFQEQDSLGLVELNKKYIAQQELFSDFKNKFNTTENNIIIKDLIHANIRIQPAEPIRNPEEYLPFIKEHYFDLVDFNNNNLIHSSILIDKVLDYVFYLTVSRDLEMQNMLYKEAVTNVLQNIDKQDLKLDFIQVLIQSFAKDENVVLTDFLFKEYYDKLPSDFQNIDFRTTIQQELKTAIGRTASEISWAENNRTLKLTELDGYDNYIIVFWSTSCPHCLKEIPKLYEYTKDNKKIKVIAIGMETEESQGTWESETYYYPEFTHILGLGKWENPIAKSYNIFATPNYFVLDVDKKIIDKPYEFVDLKIFFKNLTNK